MDQVPCAFLVYYSSVQYMIFIYIRAIKIKTTHSYVISRNQVLLLSENNAVFEISMDSACFTVFLFNVLPFGRIICGDSWLRQNDEKILLGSP